MRGWMFILFAVLFESEGKGTSKKQSVDDDTVWTRKGRSRKAGATILDAWVPKRVRIGDWPDALLFVNTTSPYVIVTVQGTRTVKAAVTAPDVVPDDPDVIYTKKTRQRLLARVTTNTQATFVYFNFQALAPGTAGLRFSVSHNEVRRVLEVDERSMVKKCVKMRSNFGKFILNQAANFSIDIKLPSRGHAMIPIPAGLQLLDEDITLPPCATLLERRYRSNAAVFRWKHACFSDPIQSLIRIGLPVFPRYSGHFSADPARMAIKAPRRGQGAPATTSTTDKRYAIPANWRRSLLFLSATKTFPPQSTSAPNQDQEADAAQTTNEVDTYLSHCTRTTPGLRAVIDRDLSTTPHAFMRSQQQHQDDHRASRTV